MKDLFSLPGGVVETGETLAEAVEREVREETGLAIEPLRIAGHRDVIVRDAGGRVEQHYAIIVLFALWRSGEFVLNEEIAEARWINPSEIGDLRTTEGLAGIVADALAPPA